MPNAGAGGVSPAGKHSLSSRDLINVGVFTAVYFVVMFAFGAAHMAGPVLALVGFVLGILANGVVIALYLARVPRFGTLTLLMVIIGLIMTLAGHPWIGLLVPPSLGLLADLIAWTGRHRGRIRNSLAYGVLSLWYVVPMLPIFWDFVGLKTAMSKKRGAEFADAYFAVFNPTNLVIIAACFFVIAFIAGMFGQRLVQKHFRQAGVA